MRMIWSWALTCLLLSSAGVRCQPNGNPFQTDEPTSVPSRVPSFVPTQLPSIPPTQNLTETPTPIPTLTPTSLPTSLPTFLPTSLPTLLPLAETSPTQSPSSSSPTASTQPTFLPTTLPSATLPTSPTPSSSTTTETATSEEEQDDGDLTSIFLGLFLVMGLLATFLFVVQRSMSSDNSYNQSETKPFHSTPFQSSFSTKNHIANVVAEPSSTASALKIIELEEEIKTLQTGHKSVVLPNALQEDFEAGKIDDVFRPSSQLMKKDRLKKDLAKEKLISQASSEALSAPTDQSPLATLPEAFTPEQKSRRKIRLLQDKINKLHTGHKSVSLSPRLRQDLRDGRIDDVFRPSSQLMKKDELKKELQEQKMLAVMTPEEREVFENLGPKVGNMVDEEGSIDSMI